VKKPFDSTVINFESNLLPFILSPLMLKSHPIVKTAKSLLTAAITTTGNEKAIFGISNSAFCFHLGRHYSGSGYHNHNAFWFDRRFPDECVDKVGLFPMLRGVAILETTFLPYGSITIYSRDGDFIGSSGIPCIQYIMLAHFPEEKQETAWV
jgi:hypothetical protein